MDLVQLREEIVNKDVPPMEKARLFMMHKAAWNLSHSQWLFFTFPLPKEVEDAIIFLELPSSEQQRQIRALQAHLERYAEDMFAERKLGHLKTK